MSGRAFPAPAERAEDAGEFVPDAELLRDPPVLRRRGGEPAGGRLGPSLATFDAPRREFEEATPVEIRDRHRPPTAWEVEPDQMESLRDFTEERIAIMRELERDPAWRYLTFLAGFMGVDISRLTQGVARRTFRDEEARQFRWALADERALERPGLGAPPTGPGPSPFVERPEPPSVLGAPPPAFGAPPPPIPIETRLRENERLRIANAAEWAWRPEVLGVIGLPPTVYAHTVKAWAEIKRRVPHLRAVPSFHAFVATKHDEICNAFADLAYHLMSLSKQKSPASAYLDKADARVKREVQRIVGAIAKEWEWSEAEGDFVERGFAWSAARGEGFVPNPELNRYMVLG